MKFGNKINENKTEMIEQRGIFWFKLSDLKKFVYIHRTHRGEIMIKVARNSREFPRPKKHSPKQISLLTTC